MRDRFPCKGDRVKDSCLVGEGIIRTGVVVGISYTDDDDCYIRVKWDDGSHNPPKEVMEAEKKKNPFLTYADYEELEYSTFFTQSNCGNGRWDETEKAWMIEPSGDELPEGSSSLNYDPKYVRKHE